MLLVDAELGDDGRVACGDPWSSVDVTSIREVGSGICGEIGGTVPYLYMLGDVYSIDGNTPTVSFAGRWAR